MIYYEAPGRLFTQSFVVDVVVVDTFRRCCSLRSCESLTTPAASVSEPGWGNKCTWSTIETRRCRQTTAGEKKNGCWCGEDKLRASISCARSHRRERRRETTEIAADLLQGILPKNITGKGGGGGGGEGPGGLPRLSECERKREERLGQAARACVQPGSYLEPCQTK